MEVEVKSACGYNSDYSICAIEYVNKCILEAAQKYIKYDFGYDDNGNYILIAKLLLCVENGDD